jgi:hypothetical protein
MGERAKYLGLVFAIAFSTFLLENQTSQSVFQLHNQLVGMLFGKKILSPVRCWTARWMR